MGKGQPLYPIERCFLGTGERFEDGSHILYVNGASPVFTFLKSTSQSFRKRFVKDFLIKFTENLHFTGACAVMALERIPADIRAAGGVSRMSDPKMIRGIQV